MSLDFELTDEERIYHALDALSEVASDPEEYQHLVTCHKDQLDIYLKHALEAIERAKKALYKDVDIG